MESSTVADVPDTSIPPSQKQPGMKERQNDHPYLTGGGGDILLLIFYLVQDTSPNTLKALALVNRSFHHLADYVRHRNLMLKLGPSELRAAHDCLQYAEKHQLLSAIQLLNVKDSGEAAYSSTRSDEKPTSSLAQYQEFLTYIANLLPSMTGLKDLIWHSKDSYSDIDPDAVFRALRLCPKVRLHAKLNPWLRGSPCTSPGERIDVLHMATTNLYALDADFTFCGAEDCLAFTRPLKHLLLSSPGVRILRIDIKQPKSGCVVRLTPRTYCGLGFVGDESLPPLEELTINNYPWGSQKGQFLSVDYPGQGLEVDHWADNFEWSRLRRLETSYVDFALKVMPKLVSLKEVDFRNPRAKSDMIRFYLECPTALESIGADKLECITLEGILRHGTALKKLRLHTAEGSGWTNTAMDIDSLRAIREHCPLIENLYLDIPRKDDWPWDMLDILASFPRLRDLTICFELGLNRDKDPVKPYVTFDTVDILYKYLLSNSPPGHARKISRFHVYSGAPPPLGHGYPAPSAFWPAKNSVDFVCTLGERDDEAARGVFKVVCPKFLNDCLYSERELSVAHRGPTPRRDAGR